MNCFLVIQTLLPIHHLIDIYNHLHLIAEKDNFVWYWTDGTERDYDNWAEDEPNYPDLDRCVYADNGYSTSEVGKWNSIKCYAPLGYVCKKPRKDDAKPTGKYIYGCVSRDWANVKVFDQVQSLTGLIENGLFRYKLAEKAK